MLILQFQINDSVIYSSAVLEVGDNHIMGTTAWDMISLLSSYMLFRCQYPFIPRINFFYLDFFNAFFGLVIGGFRT